MSNLEEVLEKITTVQEPGLCYCCGKPLPLDRKLWCIECSDPRGFVAQASKMLRGKYPGEL